MTYPSDDRDDLEDTMWLCPECGLQMYVELREGHMRTHDLSASVEPAEGDSI